METNVKYRLRWARRNECLHQACTWRDLLGENQTEGLNAVQGESLNANNNFPEEVVDVQLLLYLMIYLMKTCVSAQEERPGVG